MRRGSIDTLHAAEDPVDARPAAPATVKVSGNTIVQ